MVAPAWRLAPLAVALIAALPLRLPAQAPTERAELERFRDSLATTADSNGLLVVERRMIDLAKADRNNTLAHLKLGFLSLRLGDLGGQAHYDDAASEFQWAIDLQPTWPYPWYGMGLAEYGVGDSQVSFVTGLKTMLGKDALTRSATAFAKSAEVDPSFVRGLVELSNTALRQRVNIKLGVALDALRRSAATAAARDPEVLLARGRVEREVGDGDSALAAFRGYLDRGASRSLAQLEIARTLFLLGRFDGVMPYYDGAASDDPATVAGYRADLATIGSDSVMREFDRTAGAQRVAYLKRFWSDRDRADLRADGERLREHYRRLFYARKNFQLTSLNRHYDIVERYRSGSRDFDDRGVIYIRHGEPSSRATYAAPGLEPNESWRYTRPEGDLLFHFVAREDVQDFKLVESLFDVLGFSQQMALREDKAGDNPVAEQLMLSREELSPIYQRLQAAGRIGSGQYQAEERRMGQESIALGTSSDSYELRFARELKVHSDVLAVGTGLGRKPGADRLCDLGIEPRAGDRDPGLSLFGPGPLRGHRSDRPGGGLGRHDAPLRRRRRRCPAASTSSAVSPCRCRRASTTTGWPFSRARRPASSSRAIPCVSGGPPRPPWRSATSSSAAGDQPLSGAAPPGHGPFNPCKRSSATRKWISTTRWKG